jgi:hypothetical protein
VSLAQFFYVIVKIVLSTLFGTSNIDKSGIFGPMKSYYGMVESQNRGTLHIHLLLWIQGVPFPDAMYDKLCSDAAFKDKLFTYLDTIIKNDLSDFEVNHSENSSPEKVSANPIIKGDDIYSEVGCQFFSGAIPEYQTHVHCASCYKNPKTKGACRYRKPDNLYTETQFDQETGELNLKRNHPMINSFNPYLTSLVNSNTDVSFLFRSKSALAIMHYITMYITKSDDHVDNYYSLMCAAKQSLSDYPMQSSITDLSPPQMTARALLLRIYQKINNAIQIPSNIMATLLLDLPMHYNSDM